jgi:hypothetical protein
MQFDLGSERLGLLALRRIAPLAAEQTYVDAVIQRASAYASNGFSFSVDAPLCDRICRLTAMG